MNVLFVFSFRSLVSVKLQLHTTIPTLFFNTLVSPFPRWAGCGRGRYRVPATICTCAGVYEIMEQTKKELFKSTGVDVTIAKARGQHARVGP